MSGLDKVLKIFINVVFPAPEGPTTETISPSLIDKLTFVKIFLLLIVLFILQALSIDFILY